MDFELSERLSRLPPYLFVEIDKAKRKAREEGRDIIDLGVGDPDLPTPDHIIQRLCEAVKDPSTHRYALDQGLPVLRQAIARWYKNRFQVELDPATEILPLIGSKEGIAHFPLAFLNKGDYSLIPDPGYPPYKGGTILAGGKPYLLALKEENAFLPDLNKIPAKIAQKAKTLYINYPNNPTAGVATEKFYSEVVDFSSRNNTIVISDLAYSEMSYDGYKPPSFLSTPGAKDRGIEFHSLSKTYNMTGWRIGWACGNSRLIAGLAKVKSNIDSGIFSAIQLTGVSALEGPQEHIDKMRGIYQERRDILMKGLASLGWKARPIQATFYMWLKIPKKIHRIALGKEAKVDSMKFCAFLLDKADIVATPGVGFGKYGEGYIRMALTVPKERIAEAIERLKKIL